MDFLKRYNFENVMSGTNGLAQRFYKASTKKKTFARNKFKSTKNVFHLQHFLRQSASYSFFLLEDMFWIIKNKIKFA